MIQIQRILCPTDFSDFSRRALDHAVAIARWYESTITLLHVCTSAPVVVYVPGSGVLPSAMLTPEDRETLLASMRRFAEDEAAASVHVEFEIAEGHTATENLGQGECPACRSPRARNTRSILMQSGFTGVALQISSFSARRPNTWFAKPRAVCSRCERDSGACEDGPVQSSPCRTIAGSVR